LNRIKFDQEHPKEGKGKHTAFGKWKRARPEGEKGLKNRVNEREKEASAESLNEYKGGRRHKVKGDQKNEKRGHQVEGWIKKTT